jgi:type IV pilus assembly protein PilC
VVVTVAVLILTFIMLKIVPTFEKMFIEFELDLPAPTKLLIAISQTVVVLWWAIPLFPIGVWLIVKLLRKFNYGRMGWDIFILKIPVAGGLIEKNILARTTRTLGTLVSSGVPILEGLNITRETSGNALFEKLYGKVSEAIREGETIARPLRANCKPPFHPMALFFWCMLGPALFSPLMLPVMKLPGMAGIVVPFMLVIGMIGGLWYFLKFKNRVVDELVINMIDVGEETGELDTMLYKVADTYDDEVKTLTDGLLAMLEPLMIVFLGGAVGFIVVSLFMPLVSLIQNLSGGK